MNSPTAKQIAAIHTLMHKQGILPYKTEIIESFTGGRTGSCKAMNYAEANALLVHLNEGNCETQSNERLMRKLFALCFEMGWIEERTVATGARLTKKKDYSRVYYWVEKFGYLKKPLRKYTHNELPKLITQLEMGPYNQYIVKREKK